MGDEPGAAGVIRRSHDCQDRTTTALLVAHLGEVDARRLYAPAGYPSMFEYCVGELRFSEQTAFKRIRVARAAREHPVVYGMLADGRLNLSAIVTLTGYLTPANADELLAAAAHQARPRIERLHRRTLPAARPAESGHTGRAADVSFWSVRGDSEIQSCQTRSCGRDTGGTARPSGQGRPHRAPERYAIQCTVSRATFEKLRHAQELLGHVVPSGELAQVLDRALDVLIVQLERRKFARTDRPRRCRPSESARHVPASVKRTVRERDVGRCTFVSGSGHRCESRTRLEYDHVEPVATGGHATSKGLRLRCRAHNQLEAEQQFGRDFMNAKRETGGRPDPPGRAAGVA